MAPRAKLLELRAVLAAAGRAAEPWEASYKKHPATFRRLLDEEQALRNDLAEHYRNLADFRLSTLINWSEVRPKLQADVVVPGSDSASLDEQRLLIRVILPHYEELLQIGAAAGEALSGVTGDIPSLTPILLDHARKSTAALVKGVTDTTRDMLRRTIQSSIDSGDDLATMTARLKDVIGNPVRADLIARTETVNAYQGGLQDFAVKTGATSKEWESTIGACKLCAPLDGEVVDINKPFVLPNDDEVSRPPAHVACRCGLIYNYDQ